VLTVTPGQPDTPAHLRTGRLTGCPNRLSKLVIWGGCRVSILGSVLFPPIDDTVLGEEEREMSTIPAISEPASELERLIADLTESGLRAFVSAWAGQPVTERAGI
jgi:hypothetical protein